MSSDINEVMTEKLKREIKCLKEECLQICNASQREYDTLCRMNLEEVKEKAQCYIKALQTEIQYAETSITADEGVIINQFLDEIIGKTKQIEELTIFTQAAANDVQAKIDRLKNQIKIAEEAKCKPTKVSNQEFIQNAKLRFRRLKDHLRKLFQSIYPDDYTEIMDFMGTLMQESQNAESNAYVPVTVENFRFVEMLIKLNLVKLNPYNKKEVKLDY